MRFKLLCFLLAILMTNIVMSAQPPRRLAIVEGNGLTARVNPYCAFMENALMSDITARMAGRPGITLIDRASVDRILKEQNIQNGDRSSPDTAVRLGKLLGANQMLLVNAESASYTTHVEVSGNKTQTIGTVVLRANVRIIDVETGAILGQPKSSFQDSKLVSEISKSNGFHYGVIQVPAQAKASGGDPKVIEENEWVKAREAVSSELDAQLGDFMTRAPAAKMATALVAGIAGGSVYINHGSTSGVRAGDRFQVIREVSTGLNDPETGKPIVHKQRICTLTIVETEDANASGTCQGGLPQSKDVAEPIR